MGGADLRNCGISSALFTHSALGKSAMTLGIIVPNAVLVSANQVMPRAKIAANCLGTADIEIRGRYVYF